MNIKRSLLLGQYMERSSIIHQLDPRTKIIVIFIYMISILFIKDFLSFVFVFMILFCIIWLSKLSITYILRALTYIWIMVGITFFFHLFWSKGDEILFSIGSLHIYREGLTKAMILSFRILSLVIGASLLTLTTKSSHITDGMEKLLSPLKRFKLPTQQFALMISITLRFIPILLLETERIMKAQRSRGVDFTKGHLFRRISQFIPIIVPLIILSFQKAEQIAQAIESRGYDPGVIRTPLSYQSFSLKDYVALVICLGLFIMVVI